MFTVKQNEFMFECVMASSRYACLGDIERLIGGGYRAVITAQTDPLIEFAAEANDPVKAAWLAVGKWLDVEGRS